MTTFAEALRAAMDTTDPHAYIDRVKTVVSGQLRRLDPSAKLADTYYFNHSAIPDFVATWPGGQRERPIFLRDSYEAIVAADDENYLARIDPLLVSLDEPKLPQAESNPPKAKPEVRRRSLVTDFQALEVVGSAGEGSDSPLAGLVRANFIRGARGHIDRVRAEHLVELPLSMEGPGAEPLTELFAANFLEDAAARMSRTALLVEFALTPSRGDGASTFAGIGGQLSTAEVRSILPWLLAQPAAVANQWFWVQLARFITLADLEKAHDVLQNVDISPLVRAGSRQWSANWGYLGLAIDDGARDDGSDFSGSWSFHGGALTYDLGARRVRISRNGQVIKARPGLSSAVWEDLRHALGSRKLQRVELRGLRRAVTVSATQSPDVRSDVDEITESLEDRFYVDAVTYYVAPIRAGEGGDEITIRFGDGRIHAPGGASFAEIATAALSVLGYRDPATSAQTAAALDWPAEDAE